MRSVVLIHSILELKVRTNLEQGKTINFSEASEINFWDLYAIEAALKLKEKCGGEILALSLGSSQSEKSLRRALAFGCDGAVLINCPDDYFFNSSLAAQIIKNAVDVIGLPDFILGAYTYSDTNDPTILVQLSRLLELSFISSATKFISFDSENRKMTIGRRLKGIRENVILKLPAVITIDKEFGEPRHPSLKAIQRASKEEITYLSFDQINFSPVYNGIEYSKIVTGEWNKRQCRFINGNTPEEIAESLKSILKYRNVT